MYYPERVPEYNISVLDDGIAVCNPFWDTTGRLARCLWDMPACWVQLIIGV
jgi:hypothetical protein